MTRYSFEFKERFKELWLRKLGTKYIYDVVADQLAKEFPEETTKIMEAWPMYASCVLLLRWRREMGLPKQIKRKYSVEEIRNKRIKDLEGIILRLETKLQKYKLEYLELRKLI